MVDFHQPTPVAGLIPCVDRLRDGPRKPGASFSTAGLSNADDRRAGLQLFPGQPVIEVALEIERGHARIVWVVKPFAGTEFAPGDAGERLVHGFSRSAHAPFLCGILILGPMFT